MSIAHTAITSRQDALKDILQDAATTLASGLPETPGVYLGPARETLDGKHFCVFIARSGLPELTYDMGTRTATWTVRFDLALQSYWPQDSETLEQYCGYLAANVLGVLLGNAQRTGDDGWHRAIARSTDAIRLRQEGREGAYEIEVIPLDVSFEVSY